MNQQDPTNAAYLTALSNLNIAIGQLSKTLQAVLPYVQSTAATATAGGGAAIPATVLGFLNITLPNGTAAKVPYYGV